MRGPRRPFAARQRIGRIEREDSEAHIRAVGDRLAKPGQAQRLAERQAPTGQLMRAGQPGGSPGVGDFQRPAPCPSLPLNVASGCCGVNVPKNVRRRFE